jgi:hypothetical protein
VPDATTPAQARMRDWPMFRARAGKARPKHDGRPRPRIADLVMEHIEGSPSEKLAWLQAQKAAGRLASDDPEEIAHAEALLAMLARLAGSKPRGHLEDLLDEGLKATFPASDPVSVGHFTSTEPPSQPIDRAVADMTRTAEVKGRRTPVRARRYG